VPFKECEIEEKEVFSPATEDGLLFWQVYRRLTINILQDFPQLVMSQGNFQGIFQKTTLFFAIFLYKNL